MSLNLSNLQISKELGAEKKTIEPIIPATIKAGTLIFTDEDNIYNGLAAMEYGHKQVWFATVKNNMPEMRMAMASMKYTSRQWKASGPSCVPVKVLTGAFHKKNYRYI